MSKFDVKAADASVARYHAHYASGMDHSEGFDYAEHLVEHLAEALDRITVLERVKEAAEKTKCTTPEVTPRGNFPCFVCPVCELHRALAACDDGEGE